MNKETLRFTASAFMLMVMVSLVLYLTFIEVPIGNKDIIITILGVLLGAAAAAVPNLFGDSDKEKEELKTRVRNLEQKTEVQNAIIETLTKELTEIRTMLIERHIVAGIGIANKN